MSDNTDAIRADIEATRARLGTNVDVVADRVTPSNIVNRQTDKVKDSVKGAVTRVKEKVMGAANTATMTVQDTVAAGTSHTGDALHSTGETLHSAGENVSAKLSEAGTALSHAPGQVKAQVWGNPWLPA